MAVRPQHLHDGGIMERRLRPIYDWLDNGNNKKALQEAEKVLKKTPTLQAARALKALALLRLGKSSEAMSVLDVLTDEKPSDDTTLQAMTISYRESQQLDKVCLLYEAAVKVEPTSEELHSHLFMSYVRVGDYRSQQRAAMALYKFAPKNPYYFWAVMSIVLQAKSEGDKIKKNILLSLAQRMVENFITEKKMEAEQEARLYIMILELQENWAGIVKFMDSPLYNQLVNGSVAQASIPYLSKISHWKKLNIFCRDLLLDNPDRWDFYMPYFDSVFALMKGDLDPKDEQIDISADDTLEKCHEFICLLVESNSTGKSLRGPYLARLELWKRLSVNGDPKVLLGSGVALLVQYLRVFAHKPCAIPDLRPYFEMLSQKEREENCREFLTCLGFDEESNPETPDDIQRHVNCIGAWRLCAPPGDQVFNQLLAISLRDNYLRCLRNGLVTSTPTEFCAADTYGLLAAHHYFYTAQEQKSSRPLVEATSILELVLYKSPANFHAKLLLIRLYHMLGNALAADLIYQRVEIKHVQLVSLGWLHAARLPAALALPRAVQLLTDTGNFHTHHAKDSVEHLTYAYKYGTFEKLVSLMSLCSRVGACAWSALCGRERKLLALLPGQAVARSDIPEDPKDNRDLNVIVSWEPPQLRNKDIKIYTAEQDISYLRLKDNLVCSISLCNELADTRPVEEKRKQHNELKKKIEEFSEAMEKCKEKYSEREKISISAPFPCRIIAFVNSPVPYRELYFSTFNIIADLSVNQLPEAHATIEEAVKLVERSIAVLSELLTQRFSCDDPGWVMRETLEDMSNYLEFITVIIYILGACNELVTPTNTKKTKKKASQSPDELKTSQLLKKLNESVQSCVATLDNIFELWPQYTTSSSLGSAYDALEFQEPYKCPVEDRLKIGLREVLTDVSSNLKKKSKYLKSLIQ